MTSRQARELYEGTSILLALGELTHRQRVAVVCRDVHEWTYQRIGDSLGVTRSGARQMHAVALDRLARRLEPLKQQLTD